MVSVYIIWTSETLQLQSNRKRIFRGTSDEQRKGSEARQQLASPGKLKPQHQAGAGAGAGAAISAVTVVAVSAACLARVQAVQDGVAGGSGGLYETVA